MSPITYVVLLLANVSVSGHVPEEEVAVVVVDVVDGGGGGGEGRGAGGAGTLLLLTYFTTNFVTSLLKTGTVMRHEVPSHWVGRGNCPNRHSAAPKA